MLYPAQTSLIPVQVTLTRFIEQRGDIFGNYPFWYLGTTPYHYLTGPILPGVLAVLHRFLPNFSLFEIMLGVIGAAWVIGGLGVYLLVKEIEREGPTSPELRGVNERARRVALFGASFYLFGPIVPFLFRFSDGLYLITFSFLPYILFLYLKFLKNPTRRLVAPLIIAISFVILLDTLILPSLLLGMGAIFLAQTGWKRAEEKLKKSLLLIACSLLLVTFWYTPGYWWTLLGAPSFGGRGLALVIAWLGKLLPTALALTTAIFSVRFFKKRDTLRDFCFYWLFVFGFLSLIRFLSDPGFWLDWSAYGIELQFGLSIALGTIFFKILNSKFQIHILNLKYIFYFLCIFTIYFLQFAIIFNKYVLGTFQHDITRTVEYRISKQLSEIANPQEKVFLSGTTAFWLNSFFDISQVRGGVDQVSVHPSWRQAVWEIREGTDPQKSLEWLKKLEVDYLVVHTQASEEFYHDFAYPEKFENAAGLKKIYEGRGDRIYRVED